MSDARKTMPDRQARDLGEEEGLRRLLEAAGPRPPLPQDDLDAIRQEARGVWRRRYGTPGHPRQRVWWAGLAALLLVGLGGVWWTRTVEAPPNPAATIASVEVVSGPVRVWRATGEGPEVLGLDSVGHLAAGDQLETAAGTSGEGRLALRMAGGASVRLDAGTRLRLASPGLVELSRGGVYVDSGAEPLHPGRMAVETAAGLFRDVGTQFEVRLLGSGREAATRLRVREGSVVLGRGGDPLTTGAGEELVVAADGGLERRTVATYGPEWSWVLETAPKLDIEGVRVERFLDWIARETGWRVELADEQAKAISRSAVLHGSIEHLTVAEAPTEVLASSGLGHRVAEGTMSVFATEGEGR